MESQMSQFKVTANAHMRRDMDSRWKWVCTCDACQAIRSLVGMEKSLGVRELVRRVLDVEEQLAAEPDAAQKGRLMDEYCRLYDKLGDEMSK